MKPIFLTALLAAASLLPACSSSSDEPEQPGTPADEPKWHLVWQEEFNSPVINDEVWSRIPQGTIDWQKYQSTDPACTELRNGNLVLKGIVNPDTEADPRPYICGGVWTVGKKSFAPGSIKVRARLGNGAQGAWPAIWLMPYAPTVSWPSCGEIDIMERLNHETSVYQTVHSNYTYNLGIKDPANSITSELDPTKYHEFEAQIWTDRVDFFIDGRPTLRYPKVNGGASGQFPFFTDWELRLDMQLGGSWAGSVSPDQLPVEMEVDWVRYYQYY